VADRGHSSRAAAEVPWARTQTDGGGQGAGGMTVSSSLGIIGFLLAHPSSSPTNMPKP